MLGIKSVLTKTGKSTYHSHAGNFAEEESMRRLSATICAVVFTLLSALSVQAQMAPATPAPELKKLDFMTGDWTSEGDMKPGPGMPGGKFSISSHTEWMEGNFFLVEHSNADMAAMGKFKELAI